MAGSRLLVVCALTAALVACGQTRSANPQDTAAKVTQAIYNNDLGGATQNFDDTLKAKATRIQVAAISDKMHTLGDFKGLTETKHDDDTRRYWYDAKFSNGDMTVEMRLHADGSIAAYHVIPQATAR